MTTLIGGILRLYQIGSTPLGLDEAVLFWISQGRYADIITGNATNNSAPPLFALLLGVIIRVGYSETVLRLLPALGGILAIPAMYLLAKEFLPRDAACFCALITAVSVTQIEYSRFLREYSLTFLMASLMLLCFSRYVKKPSWANWILLSASWSAGVFLQYGLALLVASLNLVYLGVLFRKTHPRLRAQHFTRWALAQSLVVISAILVYYSALRHQIAFGSWGANATSDYLLGAYWTGSLRSLVKLMSLNTYWLAGFAYPGSLFLFLLTVGIVSSLRKPDAHIPLAMLASPMVCTFAAALARLYPYGGSKHSMFLVPMLYVACGWGFGAVSRKDTSQTRQGVVGLVLVATVGLTAVLDAYGYCMRPAYEDIRPIASMLDSRFEKGDKVYVYYGAVPHFRYYYQCDPGDCFYGANNRPQPERYQEELQLILSEPARVWMVFSHCFRDECSTIQQYAARNRQVELVQEGPNSWLYLASPR